jgi:hypothetical protein
MTRQSMLFSILAVSLAVMSLSMAPKPAPAVSRTIMASATPSHSLTGVAFHFIAVGY